MNTAASSLPVTYYASKKKMVWALAIALVFVVLGILVIANPSTTYRHSRELAVVVGYLDLGIFGAAALIVVYALIFGLPLVTITHEGLIGRSKVLIRWTNIKDIRIVEQYVANRRKPMLYIGVYLLNPSIYYDSLSSWHRIAAKSNEKLIGTPVIIGGSETTISITELLALLNTYRAMSGSGFRSPE